MKALILTLLVSLSLQAQAKELNPAQLSPVEQAELLDVLNGMETEMVHAILSEDAFTWYIQQFQRPGNPEPEMVAIDEEELELILDTVKLGYDPYNDPNAPTFN